MNDVLHEDSQEYNDMTIESFQKWKNLDVNDAENMQIAGAFLDKRTLSRTQSTSNMRRSQQLVSNGPLGLIYSQRSDNVKVGSKQTEIEANLLGASLS